MIYKDYIKLGFERYEMNDQVEVDQTGYPGYVLSYNLERRMMIQVDGAHLDRPKLMIPMVDNDERYHIIAISTEVVQAILKRTQ